MTKKKPKIIWSGEASFLNTGFSVIANQILSRLYDTNKYEIVEIGSYAKTSDPRSNELPWTFYGVIPEDHETKYKQEFDSSVYAQFGEKRLPHVMLQEKPDALICITDQWMSSKFQLKNPFIKFVKYILHPTIDGRPQKNEWIDDYFKADLLLSYTTFGRDTLLNQTAGRLKVFDVTRPTVDHHTFKPMDKKKIRQKFGIDENAKIIMTTMRNQRRKLFPDLIEDFVKLINHARDRQNEELANNTYLLLHTSYPDVGFDIPYHLKRNNIGHKVIMTYCCNACGHYYVDHYHGEQVICPRCNNLSAHMPNSSNGVTRQQLAEIFNLANLYVQYSLCEGLGCPIGEAKACEVPTLAVDYSAMSEQVEIDGCDKIRVDKFFWEPITETSQYRALPDSEDFVHKAYNFLTSPEWQIKEWGRNAREDVVENFSFDRAAKIFENALDHLDYPDHETTWMNPSLNLIQPNMQFPPNLDNNSFVQWCVENVLQKPDLFAQSEINEFVKSLNCGFMNDRSGRKEFTKEVFVNHMLNLVQFYNQWEQARYDKLIEKPSNSVGYAIL
ncbi:MAG: hypothetical protein BAJALOKI3v1_50104 [Promethearchaeota archaeon]|nr:MAG: hypothetical protein BAJALOKI3v1_50104 [Candidatus Lokiarchaeota archaeon]